MYRRLRYGRPWHFLDFRRGKGYVVTNEAEAVEDVSQLEREEQSLKSPDLLAIKGLAQFERFPAIMAFGNLVENWHVSDLHISKARAEQEAGYAEHLLREGENLPLVIEYLHKEHPDLFNKILERLRARVPGLSHVEAKQTEEGRILLKFQDGAFSDPFLARHVSDGTIKMLAYLTLLYDPAPHSLLCVEEPENQLYPTLLEELAEEFRTYANRGGQVFVSTHSPDFLNAAELNEVFWLKKEEGYTKIRRANENEQVVAYMNEGDKMGQLWKQGFFEGVDPAGMKLVFLLEERSAREMLIGLLPRLLPDHVHFHCFAFEGKRDLERNIVPKLRDWQESNTAFVILRDQDAADCKTVKHTLLAKCKEAGKEDAVVRIVCRELGELVLRRSRGCGERARLEKSYPIRTEPKVPCAG